MGQGVTCMLNYLLIKPKKIFECFICFWKWFYTCVLLVFVQNAFFCVFLQKLVQRSFCEKLAIESFPRNVLKGNKIISTSHRESRYCLASISRLNPSGEMVLSKNWKIFNFIQRLLRLSRDCFATKSFLRKLLCLSRLISRLPNPWKTYVLSFI